MRRVPFPAGLLAALAWPVLAWAQPTGPLSVPPPGKAALEQVPILRDVGVDQKLDARVPLDVLLQDESGQDVRLGRYFGARPVVLAFVYYECPMLCTQILNGTIGSIEALTFTAGKEFELVVVSFDPGETPAIARDRKATYLRRYGRPEGATGIHFLTGRESSIAALTSAVGFRYAYDAATDQYAHPAALIVATADGRLSRYLFGIEFAPRDLKFALMEASGGRIGSVADQVALFCYHYDPETGKYGLVIMTFVRAAGALTVVLIVAFIVTSVRRERRRESAVQPTATGAR
jgi:protein SCO1/2